MRYFFIVQTPDQQIGDDDGTLLSNDEVALARARKIISELKGSGDCDGWSMTVMDELCPVVAAVPF